MYGGYLNPKVEKLVALLILFDLKFLATGKSGSHLESYLNLVITPRKVGVMKVEGHAIRSGSKSNPGAP